MKDCNDRRKSNAAQAAGFVILRYTEETIDDLIGQLTRLLLRAVA